jgi:N-dimethylarginine dimethylaminohydrolase
MSSVYQSLDAIDFAAADRPAIPQPRRVVLTTPDHFDVEYVINPHMAGHEGSVDVEAARAQWSALRDTYASLDVPPQVVEGVEGLPDMVFCANQTLPYYDPRDGTCGVVLSQMHAEQRQDEVPHYADFFEGIGYTVHRLPDGLDTGFEGMGDAIWHPGRHLLWGGYGFRTGLAAYEHVAARLDVPVVALRLDDEDFYHLDTCFSVLDERSVLIYRDVFDAESQALIDRFFDVVVEAPEHEARELFACNAHCPDREHVLIQAGCTTTNDRLEAAGFTPIELDTSEFLKSGGSVFCMKQMIW